MKESYTKEMGFVGDYIVSIRKIEKSFNDLRVLNELSLDIEPGIFGLIGPNGAGKTTLIRLILGLIRPSSGTIEVLGLDIEKDSLRIRERLGVLHERPTYPKGSAPLRFLQRIHDIYGDGKSPDALLELVGLSEAADRRIGNLSAGMTQRLGIAQALVGNPELVILDEPTSNLDVVGRYEIIQLIMQLHDEFGISFIVASHVLSELERICDNVAFIRNGTIVMQGGTLELIDRFSKGRFRITTDNPQQLAPLLEGVEGVGRIRITGISTLTVVVSSNSLVDLERRIKDTAEHAGIQVYSILGASTLEDTYMEVMTGVS